MLRATYHNRNHQSICPKMHTVRVRHYDPGGSSKSGLGAYKGKILARVPSRSPKTSLPLCSFRGSCDLTPSDAVV